MGQLAIPIALAVAGAGVSMYQQKKVADARDKAALQGLLEQKREQQRANAALSEQLSNLEKSGPEDERIERSADIRKQLRLKKAMALAGLQDSSGIDATAARQAGASGTAVDYGDFIGNTLASIEAPIMQRQGEGFERADLGSYLNYLGRNSAQIGNLTRMKQAGIVPNPWLGLLAAGLSGASQGMATRGFAGGNTMAGSGGYVPGTPQAFYNANAGATLPRLQQPSGRLFNIFGP